jgi:chromosome segregation ATPase
MNNEELNTKAEDPKIKDLQMKMQVLKNAVIEERTKRGEMEKEINRLRNLNHQYEDTIHDKEMLIVNISNEKFELQSALEIERNKMRDDNMSFSDLLGGIFQRKESLVVEDKKLGFELKELKAENEMLKKKLEQQSADFDNCKIDYQNLLNIQMTKSRTLESSIVEKNKLIEENDKKLEIMFDNYKKYDVEKTKHQSIINQLTEETTLKSEKIVELLGKLEDKESMILSYKESLIRHEIESTELAKKLAELKNAIIESNMVIQSFTGEKIGSLFNTPTEVI